MIRLLHILSLAAFASACCLLGLWWNEWSHPGPEVAANLNEPYVAERFGHGVATLSPGMERVSPLVVAAQEFAAYLNAPPPPTPAAPEAAARLPIRLAESKPTEPKPVSRPIVSAVGFKLVATSYYEGRPDESMALLSEPGGRDAGRWVREGTQVGHFTVHEIRQGVVVLRDGNNTRELAVERTAIQRNLVKEVRPGTNQAKAVVQDSNDQN